MAWQSILWTTGTTGDGAAAGYTEAQTIAMFANLILNNMADEGVLKNYADGLAETVNSGATPTIDIATGGVWAKGFPAWGDASENLAVTKPVVGDTGFRVVARASGGTVRTVRLAVRMNTDGVSAFPALVQDATFPSGAGTLWEIPLYSGVVDTSGDMWKTAAKLAAGVTDDKVFCHPNIEVETAMVKDDAITLAKIPNRTRKIFVPMVGGYNMTDGLALLIQEVDTESAGWNFIDNKVCVGFGDFLIPRDFVSDIKIKLVVMNSESSTGDVVGSNFAMYGACAESIYQHTTYNILGFSGTATKLNNCVAEMTLASGVIDDIVRLRFKRTGSDVADTLGEDLYVIGWIAEYTADS